MRFMADVITRSRRNRLSYLGLLASTLIISFLYGQIDYDNPTRGHMDLVKYRLMAQAAPGLSDGVPQPFAYRILGPYLAGLLPFHDPVAFYVLTLIIIIIFAITISQLMLAYHVSVEIASFATLLFILNHYLIGFSMWDYFQINDLISLVCIATMLLALRGGAWPIFTVALLFGILAREVTLVMIPVAAVYLYQNSNRKYVWKNFALAVIPAIAIFISMRLSIPATGGPSLVEAFTGYAPKLLRPETWVRLLIIPFLPLTLIPVIFFRTTKTFFRENLHLAIFVILVFFSTLFGSDNERLMAPAGIVFYLLIAIILQKKMRDHIWTLAVLGLCAILASFHDEWARYPLLNRNLTLLCSLGATGIATATALSIVAITARNKMNNRASIPPG